jgi:TPR repeat protein
MAYAADLGSAAARHAGSSPAPCTHAGLAPALVLLAFGLSADCTPGQVGSAVRPADPTAWEVTGDGAGQCRVVSDFGEPLIVDWEAHQRGNLEEAMNDGVAVVAYDCHSLRLLRGCRIDSTYGFMAFSKKEEDIRFENADEVAANLPTFGVSLLSGVHGELTRDSTLDLAMILVGKRRTTVRAAGPDRLQGGSACNGATHYVKGAFVGAFAMGTGTKGGASLGSALFKAGSQSSKISKYRDGDADKCEQVKAESASAPENCNALIRLELVALGGAAAEADDQVTQQTCASGLVASGGKCVRPTEDQVHACKPGDATDCTAQCKKHDAASCSNLAMMYRLGLGGLAKDEARAAVLYKEACGGGNASGCTGLGNAYELGQGVARDEARAAAVSKQACDGGDARGCSNLGFLYDRGRGGLAKDEARAASLYKQACDGGYILGCSNLGASYMSGRGVTKDEARAFAYDKRACDGGPSGCLGLGYMYENGKGVARDDARAASLYKQACDVGVYAACSSLGFLYEAGRGVPTNKATAVDLFRQGCRAADERGCDRLKRLGVKP